MYIHRYDSAVDGSMHVRRVTYASHHSEKRPARSNLCDSILGQFEGKLNKGYVPGEFEWLESRGLERVKTQDAPSCEAVLDRILKTE